MAKNKKDDEKKIEPQETEVSAEETDIPADEQDAAESGTEEKLLGELNELKDNYLRLMAEYENFRKRTAKEREGLYSTAKASVIEQLLPVYDNIERAVNQPSEDEAYKKGVDMIMQQLCSSFEKLGVTEIAAAGQEFDPEKHNAVTHIEDENLGANTVAEVFQKGFEVDGRVIRHAVVQVAN